ncbi:MAG: hypothetical protein ACLT33_10705 [Lachnospira pectinoschiza]
MAAYDDVYKEFRKSDEYKALPIQRKRQRKRQLIIKIKMHRAGKKKKMMIQMSVGEIMKLRN